MLISEVFKDMTEEEVEAMNKKVLEMDEDELDSFLENIDPDEMGFVKQEGE